METNALTKYLNQPREISLETLTICNAICTFCPYPSLERKGNYMSDELMQRVLTEMSEFKERFVFSPFKVNEPFLDKRLMPYLRQFIENVPNGWLRLFSNGSPLTEKLIADINSLSRVEHLWISLNSHEKREYEGIMGISWDRTVKNLDLLNNKIASGEFNHPVIVSRVVNEKTALNGDFYYYCSARWPYFIVQSIKQDSWLGFTSSLCTDVPDAPCARWFELSILSTGVVSLCCMDGKGEFPLGDIRTSSLLEVYNQPHYRERRERLLSRKIIYPCSTCSY